MEGLAHIIKTIRLVRERLNPQLKVEGIVLTMFDGRTSLAAQVRAEAQQHLGKQIMTTVIPRNIRLSEAPSHGKPIMLYDLRSAGLDRLPRPCQGGDLTWLIDSMDLGAVWEPCSPLPALSSTEAPGTTTVELPIDSIAPNPKQPRKDFDDKALQDLSAS